MMKITKQIFAIPAEAAAMPPNPKIAAIIAITRNTHAYQSMYISSVLDRSTFGAIGHILGVRVKHPK